MSSLNAAATPLWQVQVGGHFWKILEKMEKMHQSGTSGENRMKHAGENHENSWRRLGKGRSSKDGDAESVLDCGIVDASSIPRNMRKLPLPLGSYI